MSGWRHSDHAGDESDPGPAPVEETRALEREIEHSLRRADHAITTPISRRSTGLILTAITLGLLFAATAALGTYLWRTTDEWMAEADRLETVATELATERDVLRGELDQAERDRAATDEQLREAQDRISSLASEKAQTADEREVARQVAGSVVVVANQLEVCVRGQSQLITALENIEAYEPSSVSAFAREVSAACTEALDGSNEIKRQLGIE
jgi:septal ring factor EnvC (AmiA/AmiB activator)